MIEFQLTKGDFIQLCDLLKTTGLCESGAFAKSVIAEGEVIVDGQVETRKRCKITSGQVVEFNGEKITIS